MVVIQGPRFSTRAESRWFADSGFDVVNMTQYPECWLARELELCYAGIALVTDYDVGLEEPPPVTTEVALAAFEENLHRLRDLLFRAIPRIGPQPEDACATALRRRSSDKLRPLFSGRCRRLPRSPSPALRA